MIATVIALAAPGAALRAVEDDRHREVRQWLDGEINRGQDRPAIVGFAIRFDQLFHAEVTRAELESLRIEVQGKPDHPARRKLDTHERRLTSGPDRCEWTIWFLSPERWRINKTYQFPTGIPHVDHGRDRSDSWVLMDNSLVVIDADKPPENRNYAAEDGIARMHLEAFLYAGLGRTRGKSVLSNLIVKGERWTVRRTVTLAPGSETELEFEGRWDANAGRGFVESRRIAASPYAETIGTRWEYAQWQHEPLLDVWVSKRVDQFDPSGKPEESLEWQSVTPVSQKEVEAMIAVPDPLASDVVRGRLKVRQVSDYRANARVFKSINDDGVVQTHSQERGSPRGNMQLVGWMLATLIVAALVFIRVRRGVHGS